MSHAFWKENIEDRVKFLESIALNIYCCVKVTKADLHKIHVGVSEVSENLAPKFPSKGGAISFTPLPPCSPCIFFSLSAMNGP